MFEWKYLFSDTILESGKEVAKNSVKKITVDDDGLTASVQGTEAYTVSIDKSLDKITCTCPCEFRCKHMAAVLSICEQMEKRGIMDFFSNAADSPLAKLAETKKTEKLERIAKAEEKQRLKEERYRQWLLDAPKRKAEQEEKERRAAQRKLERERREAEERKRQEELERQRKLQAKEERAKRKALAEKQARERAEAKAKEIERLKRVEMLKAQEMELREVKEIVAAKKAEIKRQNRLDIETRKKIKELPVEQKKQLMQELAEIDRRIAQLKGIDGNNTKSRQRMAEVNYDLLEETGWAYSDMDDMEGYIYMDGFGRTYYLPDGYRVSNDEDD